MNRTLYAIVITAVVLLVAAYALYEGRTEQQHQDALTATTTAR